MKAFINILSTLGLAVLVNATAAANDVLSPDAVADEMFVRRCLETPQVPADCVSYSSSYEKAGAAG